MNMFLLLIWQKTDHVDKCSQNIIFFSEDLYNKIVFFFRKPSPTLPFPSFVPHRHQIDFGHRWFPSPFSIFFFEGNKPFTTFLKRVLVSPFRLGRRRVLYGFFSFFLRGVSLFFPFREEIWETPTHARFRRKRIANIIFPIVTV